MKFDRNALPDGKQSYLVFDLEDLAGRRSPVCLYPGGRRAEAIDHAEDRGGIVVSADWKGFIDCEYVSSKVEPGDIVEIASTKRLNEGAFRFALKALTFIRVNSEPGSRRHEFAERGFSFLTEQEEMAA